MKTILFFLIIIFSGCRTSFEVTRFNDTVYKPTDSVEVFTKDVKRKYIEIGVVESRGAWTYPKEKLLKILIEQAKENGADALIKLEFFDIPDYDNGQTYLMPHAKAVMIRWLN